MRYPRSQSSDLHQKGISRYLSRRRRIEIAHNLSLTERQIKVRDELFNFLHKSFFVLF